LLTNVILPRLFAGVVSLHLPADAPIGVLRARLRRGAIRRGAVTRRASCLPNHIQAEGVKKWTVGNL
jgi:hypothetical protein